MPQYKRKKKQDDDDVTDVTWKPPSTYKVKPKNLALLVSREKKSQGKGKSDIQCECGRTCTTREQLKKHRKMHGS